MDLFDLDAYDYQLPPELVAQTPLPQRDASRLMVVERASRSISHRVFSDLPEILMRGDLLVLNDSRVLPARLKAKRSSGGAVELLLVEEVEPGVWSAMVRPGRRARRGDRLYLGEVELEVQEVLPDGLRLVRFPQEDVLSLLEAMGEVPLPPYIKGYGGPRDRYQTVYSRVPGSVAAPTAGLHFTEELLERLKAKGVLVRYVTLHVGPGTFRPVESQDIRGHRMHRERFFVPAETAAAIEDAKRAGGRVVAVGTTVVRVLEHCGLFGFGEGWSETELFIYPGFEFKVVDAMITNFHMPRSTLLMLVCAFGGYDLVMRAYAEAVSSRYRFLSFGDAMLLI